MEGSALCMLCLALKRLVSSGLESPSAERDRSTLRGGPNVILWEGGMRDQKNGFPGLGHGAGGISIFCSGKGERRA